MDFVKENFGWILFGVVVIGGLIWLFSGSKKTPPESPPPKQETPVPVVNLFPQL